ncbi:hypothetical protein Pst134EA_013072 [Puccinia striiformis f. sp. tritici]|uniref:hypothetical protein n=1 Tax=Puccinia striiformis f. sp. tritici TaxID=168172 RepID=UPI00200756E3|nr:hypothetical protein Pst134EA_013072 [Puccinia striiformis f. sp. tritici]KAH9453956.1 hypothetical protein Pst134EB_014057 [Puccinia striiformis f. sp. tritici]KAH9465179.1 hypothetical protein Pst134EA_013072 [Puccinia striiformis f. sp. tritici]
MASNKPPGWDIFGGGGLARRLTEDPNQFSNEVSGESCKYVAARSIRLVCGRTSREIMAGFIEKGLGGLTLNASENDQLRQQGDLVIKGFGVLAKNHSITRHCPDHPFPYQHRLRKYLPALLHRNRSSDRSHWSLQFLRQKITRHRPDHPFTSRHRVRQCPPDPLDCTNNLNRFHWSAPFLLKEQITSLLELLDPFLLRSQPGPTLKLILKIQAEIDESLNQIKNLFLDFPPCPHIFSPSRVDDGHLQDYKEFRIAGLECQFKDLTRRNQHLFAIAGELIQHMRLSTDDQPQHPNDLYLIKKDITECASDSIEDLAHVVKFTINTRIHSSEATIQLAKKALPLFKLSRLLLKKLSKRGMSREQGIGSDTELCTKQLYELSGFGCMLQSELRGISGYLITSTYPEDHEDLARKLVGLVESIEIVLESPLAVISSHVAPILTANCSIPVQNYYREWLVSWSAQFDVAIGNFKDATELYKNNIS